MARRPTAHARVSASDALPRAQLPAASAVAQPNMDSPVARPSHARARRLRAQAATWAWAGKTPPRLGRFWPGHCQPLIFIGRLADDVARIKTATRSSS